MIDSLFSEMDLDPEMIELERRMEERKKLEEAKDAPATVVAEEPKVFDKKLYILDGYSIIYRSYFAHITSPLTDKEGKNRTIFEVIANNAQFVETKRDSNGEAPVSFSNASVNEFTEVPGESDEDLPF